jgi:hypothetical protein
MITFTYSSSGKTAESHSSPLGHNLRSWHSRHTGGVLSATGRTLP